MQSDALEKARQKLARLPVAEHGKLNRVQHNCLDLGSSFVDSLTTHTSFNALKPCFIVWEGVTPYLTEDAVRSTLKTISSQLDPNSIVVFDYWKDIPHESALNITRERQESGEVMLADLGEPIRFKCPYMLSVLVQCGFSRVKTFSYDEIALLFDQGYDPQRNFRYRDICIASKSNDSAVL